MRVEWETHQLLKAKYEKAISFITMVSRTSYDDHLDHERNIDYASELLREIDSE